MKKGAEIFVKQCGKKLKSAKIVRNYSSWFFKSKKCFLKSNVKMIFAMHFTSNKICCTVVI